MAHVIPHKKFEEILASIKADKKITAKQNALSFYDERACLVTFKPAKSLKDAAMKSAIVDAIVKVIPARKFTVDIIESGNEFIANIKIISTIEEEVMFE